MVLIRNITLENKTKNKKPKKKHFGVGFLGVFFGFFLFFFGLVFLGRVFYGQPWWRLVPDLALGPVIMITLKIIWTGKLPDIRLCNPTFAQSACTGPPGRGAGSPPAGGRAWDSCRSGHQPLCVRQRFPGYTVCPRSSYLFYIVNCYIKWVTTSWTNSNV